MLRKVEQLVKDLQDDNAKLTEAGVAGRLCGRCVFGLWTLDTFALWSTGAGKASKRADRNGEGATAEKGSSQ